MAKPKAIRVPSDDCIVTVGGVACAPHEGEWVEIIPIGSIAEMRASIALQRLQVEMDAAKGEPDEQTRIAKLMDIQAGAIAESLSRRVVAWTWTDMLGNPLPQPLGNQAVIEQLDGAEIFWLMSATQGETPTAVKNA